MIEKKKQFSYVSTHYFILKIVETHIYAYIIFIKIRQRYTKRK